MYRDRDNRDGNDDREAVFEHVYFRKPKLLYGKEIGVGVHTYSQKSKEARNDFKIAIFNQYGYQLWPNKGQNELIHDPEWMFTAPESKSNSVKRKYKV